MAPEPTPTFAEFAIFRVPLVRKGTWQTAGGRQADATTLILRATLTTGEALCSESILLPGHVAESAASAWAELQRVAPLMLAALPGTAPATTSTAVAGLFDQIAWECLRRLPAPARVPIAGTVAAADLQQAIAESATLVEQGCTTLKVKITPATAESLIEALQGSFPQVSIAVDANGSFNEAQLPQLGAWDRYDLAFLEDPFPAAALALSARLQQRLRTPICLDLGIIDSAAAEAAIRARAGRLLNLKVSRLGGFTPAHEIASLAAEAGIACRIGSLLESAVGTAAHARFGSLPIFTLPAGLVPPARLYTTPGLSELACTRGALPPSPAAPTLEQLLAAADASARFGS